MERPICAQARQGNQLLVDDRSLLTFAGSDYLGMAREPRVLAAAREALERYGLSASASRWTTGTTVPHEELERAAARFCGTEDAALLPIGYLANQALLEALDERVGAWFVDERAHASLFQALRHVGSPHHLYRHRDAEHLGELVARHAEGVVCGVLSDGLFPNDGALAPLPDLLDAIPPERSLIVIDDAHGLGVLGPSGRGTLEHFDAPPARVRVASTLSKAFGAYGGILPGPRELCEAVRQRVALYIGATPIPASLAAAGATAIDIARREPHHLEALRANIEHLRSGLARLGLPAPLPGVPIFAFAAGTGIDPAAAHARLLADGLLVPHSLYPGSPPGGQLRGTLSATHTTAEVERLLDALATTL